jgi:hypothetical protein
VLERIRRRGATRELLRDNRRGRLATRALRDLAGTNNGVVYDLPRSEKPAPIPGSIFVRGTASWRQYLDAREQADSGQPAILFALRPLDNEERNLVVDWGTTYPNTFFLIEPEDWRCDLTDPETSFSRDLDEAIEQTLRIAPPEAHIVDGWTRATPLGRLLGELFGRWVYWSGPAPYGQIQEVPLDLTHGETVWGEILNELTERFPQVAYDRALAYLNDWERELLGGPLPRAQSVFRTRLGMPILRDPRDVDRAVRRLVNEGRMSVIGATLPGKPIFGRGRPVPEEISEDEFARFLMA